MRTRFHDRTEAGRILAGKLGPYLCLTDAIVVALPRGGVPVGAEVAEALHLPLDILVVRKLDLPGFPELAMGAIASGGVQALNEALIREMSIGHLQIEEATGREGRELWRREDLYREGVPPLELTGKAIILVDDGIATGCTVLAALTALRQQHVARIVVATPVIAPEALRTLESLVDEIVYVACPLDFRAVGAHYDRFAPTTDAEVKVLLDAARRHRDRDTAVAHS